MCTVTWQRNARGYELLCNRDEKRWRQKALAPAVYERDGVRFAAPLDGDFGGTWIAINEYGLTLCLVNGTGIEPRAQTVSRGLLVLDLVSSAGADLALGRLEQADLQPYQPFHLLALEPGAEAVIASWDGRNLAVNPRGDAAMPLMSSSHAPEEVLPFRRDLFRRHPGRLLFFHESHAGGPGAQSPCMHREDAETVSFSWIKVDGEQADFFYSPEAPCRHAAGMQCSLALQRKAELTCTP